MPTHERRGLRQGACMVNKRLAWEQAGDTFHVLLSLRDYFLSLVSLKFVLRRCMCFCTLSLNIRSRYVAQAALDS